MSENIPFAKFHLFKILDEFDQSPQTPLDYLLRRYFKAHRSVGSHDRKYIAETVYAMVRWLGAIEYGMKPPITWEKRVAAWENFKIPESAPPHIQVSFPKWLFDRILDSQGEKRGRELCLASNSQAPTTVRINPLKTTREALLKTWGKDYPVSPCKASSLGITFGKRVNFFTLPEFKAGLFEVQDEGSQLLADLIDPSPKQSVLDFCAGSGGKTLAFAHKLQGTGQLYLYDVRPHALADAKKRLKRAGIQNGQILHENDAKHKLLKRKMDWVMVDAPCSGTGTLRRNPDMKWRLSEEDLKRLVGLQRTIFEKALSYLKPGGKIVYGTCSLLREENQNQVEHFLNTYPLELISSPPFQTLPEEGGPDGFFGAVFSLNK